MNARNSTKVAFLLRDGMGFSTFFEQNICFGLHRNARQVKLSPLLNTL